MDSQTLVSAIHVGVLFVLGTAIGSFLNVVIYRVPLGLSLLEPPSSCPKCGGRIALRDNVPLFGWLFLGGKCRRCRSPISVRYPAVELATGILWALEGWRLSGMQRGYWTDVSIGLLELAFVSAMVVTFLIDLDHRIILDEISLGGLALALAAAPFLPSLHHAETPAAFTVGHPLLAGWLSGPAWLQSLAAAFVGAATGLAFSLGVYFLGNIAFRKQIEAARREDPDIDSALGWGDVKLMTCFGAFLGWLSVLFIFMVASIMGAVTGSACRLLSGDPGGARGLAGWRNRWRTGGAVVPFGPFLALAALLFHFFGDRFLSLYGEVFRNIQGGL